MTTVSNILFPLDMFSPLSFDLRWDYPSRVFSKEIIVCREQDFSISFTAVTSNNSSIAVVTEQPPDMSADMIMVHREFGFKLSARSETNSTASVLSLKKIFILFSSKSVASFKSIKKRFRIHIRIRIIILTLQFSFTQSELNVFSFLPTPFSLVFCSRHS